MPERNGQTDGQTDRLIAISISRVSVLTRNKNLTKIRDNAKFGDMGPNAAVVKIRCQKCHIWNR